MDMTKKSWELIIIILIVMTISACATPQPATETSKLTEIVIIFDGENCMVSGHKLISEKMILFSMENQSDMVMNLAIAEIKDDRSADEVFMTFSPASIDFPDGASYNARSDQVPAGANFIDLGILLLPGNYAVICENYSTLEKYYGAGFSVPQ